MNENSTSNLPEDSFTLDGLRQPDSASMRNKLLGPQAFWVRFPGVILPDL